MKILITGVAGFIGYSLADNLLKQKNTVFGLDNFDDYYSVSYKKKRISTINKWYKFPLILFIKMMKNFSKKYIK